MVSKLRWATAVGVALAGIALVSASCGDDSSTTAKGTASAQTKPEVSAARVDVTVKEWSISTAATSIKAGEVRFFAKNTGKELHELIVLGSDTDPAKLPTYGPADKPAEGHAVGDVDEATVTPAGEIDDIAVGATKDATFELKPGKYVLFCNLPAHYAQGMRVAFTVN